MKCSGTREVNQIAGQSANNSGRKAGCLCIFSLALPDGTEAVSTFGGEPELVVVGMAAFLTEGLELAIIGLKKGDRQTLELTPEQAFGAWDE